MKKKMDGLDLGFTILTGGVVVFSLIYNINTLNLGGIVGFGLALLFFIGWVVHVF